MINTTLYKILFDDLLRLKTIMFYKHYLCVLSNKYKQYIYCTKTKSGITNFSL